MSCHSIPQLSRYQAALGNALAGEALLPVEGVSAGAFRAFDASPAGRAGEAQLRGQVRSQVQLGNEFAGEALLPVEGVSAGGFRAFDASPASRAGEAQLRGQVRSQVQLGNES